MPFDILLYKFVANLIIICDKKEKETIVTTD